MRKLSPAFLKQCAKIIGKENILTDDVSLALYSYDCSLSHTKPEGVLLIRKAEWLAPLVTLLYQYKIPFVPRASATNHAGGCTPLNGGVILNLTHLNHILEINTAQEYAWVEPGVVTAHLTAALASYGFFYAPDPASSTVCTIGGNFAQNASGARCMKYGGTLNHVLEADVILPNGEPLHLSLQEPGADLLGLLAGSEGTLGLITRLKVKILPLAKHIKTFLVPFPSLQESIQAVTDLVAQGILPRCVEALDQSTIQAIENFAHAGYPIAPAVLLFELDGDEEQINKETQLLQDICSRHHALDFKMAEEETEREKLWKARRSAYAAMAQLAPNVLVGDGTVPRSELPNALQKIRQLLDEHHLRACLLFHAGDGNFHPQIVFNGQNKQEVIQVKNVLKQILKTCVDCQGTLSGEHGIGVEKRSLMTYQYDKQTLDLFARIKHATDPDNLANPLKILPVHYEEEAKNASFSAEYQVIHDTLKEEKPFRIVGTNSRLGTKESSLFSTRRFNRILEIDTTNYVATAQTGVLVNDLIQTLSAQHLFCSWAPSAGTLGGAFASGCMPDIYQHILGVEAFLPDGSFIRYGGKFVKNAAGYPLTRLLAGSQGEWALITQLTFRIFASPVPVAKEKPFKSFQWNTWSKALKKELDPKGIFK